MQKTYNHPWNIALQQLESITTSESELTQSQPLDLLGQKRTDVNRKGDYWELYVSMIAMEKGAEVYRNMSCVGKTDIVLEINGKHYPINVKAMCERSKAYPGRYYHETLNKLPEDVYMVSVNPVTRDICWHHNRIPAGLEDFWV